MIVADCLLWTLVCYVISSSIKVVPVVPSAAVTDFLFVFGPAAGITATWAPDTLASALVTATGAAGDLLQELHTQLLMVGCMGCMHVWAGCRVWWGVRRVGCKGRRVGR